LKVCWTKLSLLFDGFPRRVVPALESTLAGSGDIAGRSWRRSRLLPGRRSLACSQVGILLRHMRTHGRGVLLWCLDRQTDGSLDGVPHTTQVGMDFRPNLAAIA
jgi:hypothetical protein